LYISLKSLQIPITDTINIARIHTQRQFNDDVVCERYYQRYVSLNVDIVLQRRRNALRN